MGKMQSDSSSLGSESEEEPSQTAIVKLSATGVDEDDEDDEDEEVLTPEEIDCPAFKLVQDLQGEPKKAKKALLLLCLGLKEAKDDDEEKDLLNIEDAMFNAVAAMKRRDYIPDKAMAQQEVKRRAKYYYQEEKELKNSSWSLQTCIEWLKEHPITNDTCISYITSEVARLRQSYAALLAEEQDVARESSGSNWTGLSAEVGAGDAQSCGSVYKPKQQSSGNDDGMEELKEILIANQEAVGKALSAAICSAAAPIIVQNLIQLRNSKRSNEDALLDCTDPIRETILRQRIAEDNETINKLQASIKDD